MRHRLGILVLLLIGGVYGCAPESPLVSACEGLVLPTLASPSTYERTDLNQAGSYVEIKYDVANAFGTPVRGRIACTFAEIRKENPFTLVEIDVNGEVSPETLSEANKLLRSQFINQKVNNLVKNSG